MANFIFQPRQCVSIFQAVLWLILKYSCGLVKNFRRGTEEYFIYPPMKCILLLYVSSCFYFFAEKKALPALAPTFRLLALSSLIPREYKLAQSCILPAIFCKAEK